ncbi:MAG: hypothetical protein PHI73_01895 [Patescibacteria group bacterium]|nr:hypothetical protein [Patescibacteria group bacterium]
MERILVFDINLGRLASYSDLLAGVEVCGASDLASALTMISCFQPDLVLAESDESPGLRLVQESKKLRLILRPPIYLMANIPAGQNHAMCRKAARQCGADGFIPRSVNPALFRLIVNAALFRAIGHNQGNLERSGPTHELKGSSIDQTAEPDRQTELPDLGGKGHNPAETTQPLFTSRLQNQLASAAVSPGDCLHNIAVDVGGWRVLSDIAYACDLPGDPQDHHRLVEILRGWGKKPPLKRLVKAHEITQIMFDWLRRRDPDPVYTTLFWIAYHMVQEARRRFWERQADKLVAVVGDWRVLDQILVESALADPAELDRLACHLKEWNSVGDFEVVIRAVDYTRTQESGIGHDRVLATLKEIAGEMLFGQSANEFGQTDNPADQTDADEWPMAS